jgi:hypothetical protein
LPLSLSLSLSFSLSLFSRVVSCCSPFTSFVVMQCCMYSVLLYRCVCVRGRFRTRIL